MESIITGFSSIRVGGTGTKTAHPRCRERADVTVRLKYQYVNIIYGDMIRPQLQFATGAVDRSGKYLFCQSLHPPLGRRWPRFVAPLSPLIDRFRIFEADEQVPRIGDGLSAHCADVDLGALRCRGENELDSPCTGIRHFLDVPLAHLRKLPPRSDLHMEGHQYARPTVPQFERMRVRTRNGLRFWKDSLGGKLPCKDRPTGQSEMY